LLGRGKETFSPTANYSAKVPTFLSLGFAFHIVVALQFSSMEGEILHVKWTRQLSQNQIQEIVMDSDSDEEKYYASEDTEDDEPCPHSQPPSPDFSASNSDDEDDVDNVAMQIGWPIATRPAVEHGSGQ
jgi:hypothetical protein